MVQFIRRQAERDANMFVIVPSTPAQYFHALRRQANLPYKRPLICMVRQIRPCGCNLCSPLFVVTAGLVTCICCTDNMSCNPLRQPSGPTLPVSEHHCVHHKTAWHGHGSCTDHSRSGLSSNGVRNCCDVQHSADPRASLTACRTALRHKPPRCIPESPFRCRGAASARGNWYRIKA